MVSSLSLFLGTVAEALKGPLEVLKRTPFGKKSFLKFTLHYKNCPGPYLATVQFIWVIRLQVNFHSVHCSELDFHKGKTKMDLLHEGFSCVPYPRWFCKLSHLDFQTMVNISKNVASHFWSQFIPRMLCDRDIILLQKSNSR